MKQDVSADLQYMGNPKEVGSEANEGMVLVVRARVSRQEESVL